MRTLRLGDRGEDVREWYDFLIAQKLLSQPTGRRTAVKKLFFEKQVAGATREFQAQNGVPVSGEVDAMTLEKAMRKGFTPHAGATGGFNGTAEVEEWHEAADLVNKNYSAARARVFGKDDVYAQKTVPNEINTTLCLFAAKLRPDDAAMVAALWAKESNFRNDPDGDAGPAQLNYFWIENHPELIAGDAYGTWTAPRAGVPFDGSILDNLVTLGNIVRFQRLRGNTYGRSAFEYGPNQDPSNRKMAEKEVRARYQNDVMSRYAKYLEFFRTITDGAVS